MSINNVYKTDKRDTNEIRSRAAFHGKDVGKDSIHRGLDPRIFPPFSPPAGNKIWTPVDRRQVRPTDRSSEKHEKMPSFRQQAYFTTWNEGIRVGIRQVSSWLIKGLIYHNRIISKLIGLIGQCISLNTDTF